MSWGLCVGVLGRFFFVVYSLVCGSGIPFVGCDCVTVDVVDSCMHFTTRNTTGSNHGIILLSS